MSKAGDFLLNEKSEISRVVSLKVMARISSDISSEEAEKMVTQALLNADLKDIKVTSAVSMGSQLLFKEQ